MDDNASRERPYKTCFPLMDDEQEENLKSFTKTDQIGSPFPMGRYMLDTLSPTPQPRERSSQSDTSRLEQSNTGQEVYAFPAQDVPISDDHKYSAVLPDLTSQILDPIGQQVFKILSEGEMGAFPSARSSSTFYNSSGTLQAQKRKRQREIAQDESVEHQRKSRRLVQGTWFNTTPQNNPVHSVMVQYKPMEATVENRAQVDTESAFRFVSNNTTRKDNAVVQQGSGDKKSRTISMGQDTLDINTAFSARIGILGKRSEHEPWKDVDLNNVRIEIAKAHIPKDGHPFSLKIYNLTIRDQDFKASDARFKIVVRSVKNGNGDHFDMKRQSDTAFKFTTK